MRKLLCCTLLLSVFSCLYAQHSQVLPPSPEAASLSKYAEFPVSYFAGLPQINLPLYEIRVDDVTIPISISYHGGGIQATEEASRVGLGWTLNAGGVITRTVRGLPDEMVSGNLDLSTPSMNNFEDNTTAVRGYFHLTPKDKFLLDHLRNKVNDVVPMSAAPARMESLFLQTALKRGYDYGRMDVAQDIYSFNFMGNSGIFMFDEHQHIIAQTESLIEFKPMMNSHEFIMSDKDNNKYYFETQEISYHEYSLGDGSIPIELRIDSVQYTSAWYLSRIVTPQGNTINFAYKEMPPIKVYNGNSEQRTVVVNKFHGFIRNSTSNSYTKIIPQRLDEIRTKDIKIQFISDNTARLDIQNDRSKLSYIQILNQNDEIVKKIAFDYSYFRAYPSSNSPLFYRLKLDALCECSISNNQYLPLYNFSYVGNGIIEPKSTLNKDYWGYFNTNESNISTIPPVPYLSSLYNDNANRNPDAQKMQQGTLSCIRYAMGGETAFYWEPNDFSYIKRLPVTDKEDLPSTGGTIMKETLCGLKSGTNPVEKLSIDILINKPQVVKLFTKSYYAGLAEFMRPEDYRYYYMDHDESNNLIPTLDVYNVNTGKNIKSIYLDKNYFQSLYNRSYDAVSISSPGLYRFVLSKPRGGMTNYSEGSGLLAMFEDEGYYQSANNYGIIPIEYSKYPHYGTSQPETKIVMAGGLRIKEIHSNTLNGNVIKSFFYKDMSKPMESSGVLVDYPQCYSSYLIAKVHSTTNLPAFSVFPFTNHIVSSDGLYHTFPGKQNVEYRVVTEIINPKENIEWIASQIQTKYFYSTIYDSNFYEDIDDTVFGLYQSSSARIRTSKAHWRGNLKKIVYSDGRSERKVTTYDYLINEDKNDHFFTGDFFMLADYSNSMEAGWIYNDISFRPYKDFGITKFRIIPYNKMLASKTESTQSLESILELGEEMPTYSTDTYKESVNYKYFYPEYGSDIRATLPLAEERTNSIGKTETIYYSYFSRGTKVNTQVRVVDGYIVEAKRYDYDQTTWLLKNTYTALIPSDHSISAASYSLGTSYYASTALNQLINNLEYSYKYDGNNRIKEVYFKGIIIASYLWGYQGSHPIAEIKNATASEVDAALASIGKTRTQLYNATGTAITGIDDLRSKLPKAEITTMTYHWMMGVYSKTDARGVTTYYKYDDYGRLKGIENYNRYVLEQYDYHYRNQ